MENAIEICNVSKLYKLYDKPQDRVKELFSVSGKVYHHNYRALDNINISVKKGETLGIIGKNGAGKSTLLKLITGVITPTEGQINTNGEISALLELGTGFNPEYTGIENIYLNGSMRGLSDEEIGQKLDEIIEFADIGDYIKQPVKTYSSGMFARLAFSVMISFKPEILIVDEALSVGDVFFQQKCNTFMKEQMKGVTKILVTHDMNSIANMADRVILLDHGEIIKEGNPLDVIQNYLQIMHTEVFSDLENKSDKDDEQIMISPELKESDAPNDEGWIAVDKSEVGGAGDILITACKIEVNETRTSLVKPEDVIDIYIKIYSKKNISDMIIGYILKDKYGNSIAGENSIGSNVSVEGVERNKEYVYRITLKWPQIKEGDYFVTVGIGEGTDQMVHTIQCWAHNVIHLEAMSLIPMHGVINNNIIDIVRV